MNRAHPIGTAAVVLGIAFPLVALTCAEPKLTPAPPPAASPSTPVVKVSATAPSALPATSTTASASASSALMPATSASTTPGKVQCVTTSCDTSTEICCASEDKGRCISKAGASTPHPCNQDEAERHCDEAVDCGAGERCCHAFDYNDSCEATERWRCTKGGCGNMPDSTWDLCLLGSTCPSGPCKRRKGDDSPETHGYCPLDTIGLNCGSAKCARGEACCWDAKAKKGKCTSDGTCTGSGAGATTRLFACQHPSDCGAGLQCANVSGATMNEEFTCMNTKCSSMTLYLGPLLCDKIGDCPPAILLGNPPNEYHLAGCTHRPDDPAKVKTCNFR